MLDARILWKAPDLNPVNQKARSIPALNPIDIYGRVFTFAWFGFMVAFMSWYAIFVPLAICTFLILAAGMRFHHWYDIYFGYSRETLSAESPGVHSDPGHS